MSTAEGGQFHSELAAEAERLDRDAIYDAYQRSQGNPMHDPKFAAVIAERDTLRSALEETLRALFVHEGNSEAVMQARAALTQ